MTFETVLAVFVSVGFIAYGLRMRRIGMARIRREEAIRGKIKDCQDIEFIGLSQRESNSSDVAAGYAFIALGLVILFASLLK